MVQAGSPRRRPRRRRTNTGTPARRRRRRRRRPARCPGTMRDASSVRSPNASAHASGSPSKQFGVTPKTAIAPAKSTSASGANATRFSRCCPVTGNAQTDGVSQAASFTVCDTGRVREFVVERLGVGRVQMAVHADVRWLIEQCTRLWPSVSRRHPQLRRPADELDVACRVHDPPDRSFEVGDCFDERFGSRRCQQTVDHRQPIVIDDDAGVRVTMRCIVVDPRPRIRAQLDQARVGCRGHEPHTIHAGIYDRRRADP